ncbi:exportin-6-like [Portunus trituberculatus]|uniref:Exportin-6 n=1 Tax=Portunus trituberculatus TaxID=210409 RepID=A0A5B7CH35_PORTR|nr:exportin-6-like [Portunus trituberculatus]MPC08061.1 Exportin-6 [Portunus trituberculatus]
MATDQASLMALEGLMTEFFGLATSNSRKHDIETILGNFGQQRGAWKQCLYYLAHTHNSYVSMYCLTTLENIINKQWVGLMPEERTEIRSTLYRFVLENHKVAPYYIRNKLVKLVVDIARLSWPHFYPDFFTNVLSLSRSPDTVVLCIVFLQTISEELACPREELSYSRRTELRRLLSQQVPTMLTLLSGLLEGVVEKHKNAVTATPPPSPTHSHSHSPSRSGLSSSPIQTGSLLSNMFHSLESGPTVRMGWVLPPLDPESETIASLALNCLTHLFSWIPLSSLITPHLLNTIFLFASLGADPQHNRHHNGLVEKNCVSGESLGVLAMGAINEIMSKNCVPHDFEDFLLQMFRNTFHLLQRLVREEPNTTSRLQLLDPSYIDKFSEFLRLFVSVHLRRFENNSQFPVLEFLALLFRYTFRQHCVEAYFNCLDVWSIFLDHLSAKAQGSQERAGITRYTDALISLARGILHKIQHRHNQAELEELDHEIREEILENNNAYYGELGDGEDVSEWHSFFTRNLELVAKIAELLPDEIFSLVYEPWNDATKIYLSLQSNMVEQDGRRRLNISAEHECPRLHCLLRDLSSLLQAIGRLSTLFLGEELPKRSTTAVQVIDKLVQMANYSTGLKLFEVQTAVEVLHSDFVEVHAQVLSTLRAWVHWLSQLYGQQFVQVFPGGTQTHQHQDTCHTINKQMLVAATSILNVGAPPLIVNCGVQLLLSLSVMVRSPVALEMNQVQSLYVQAPSILSDLKVRGLILRALVNFLLLPWPSFVVDHKLDTRKHHLTTFINSFTSDIRKLDVQRLADDKSMQESLAPKLCDTLSIIQYQVGELNNTDKASRELYYHCVQDVIHQAILLFPIYVQHTSVCEEILALMVVVMQVLRVQLGAVRVEATIQTFLDVFTTRHHLQLAITTDNPAAVRVVDKFLKLLELIVSEPGQSFKRFIPNTITLCMDHIYPIVSDHTSPEVKSPLFELLRCLLEHNWKYFFKPSIHISLGAGNWDSIENEAQFIQIMQAFGQSFMQPDITIFKHNLEAMESLNSKYKLYHKGVFRNSLLVHFITVLLQVLVHRSQDLLQEEITITVYNMAAVDFSTYFGAFVPHFLQNMDGLDADQRTALKANFKTDTDLPTFTQNVQRFINDLRYYRTCNASLPPGTVKL